jgi:D-serine deaminase-like pyridoxal phosphate-dependent protein
MPQNNMPFLSLDTPAVLVDMDKLEANIREMSQLAADAGIRLRPHVKVHECAEIAKMQIEAGACGIEVGPVAQAETMAEKGFDDIIIAHPGFYGDHKLETLKRLINKPRLKVTVVVDMFEQAEGISQAGQAVARKVPVLLKIETNRDAGGSQRYGVLPGEPVLNLARKLCQLPYIEFKGIYAHEEERHHSRACFCRCFAYIPCYMPSYKRRKIPRDYRDSSRELCDWRYHVYEGAR